jgi:DNA replication licensing factor MCM6
MDDTEYAEQVEAAAEVAIQTGGNNGGRRGGNNNNANEQAQMGVSADGVEGYQAHNDPSGRLVQTRFYAFLNDYQEDIVVSSDAGGLADNDEDGTAPTTTTTTVFPYVEQAATLREDDSQSNYHSTLWVDFAHVKAADEELAEAIQLEYHRFDPFLRQAAAEFVQLDQMRQRQQPPGGENQQPFCFVAFCNVTPSFAVRDLRMDQIGRLVGVSGTVTRTSDVRPELLTGVFRCESCGLASDAIPQQFHFTKPPICRNPRCKNTSHFTLEADGSVFCDWQKLKLQESSDEIPPGSMPRSLDVYLRHELVEKAKAGDAVLLTGCLVVIPDGSALAKAGEAPRTRQTRMTAADSRGVRGLKATGARELTYRTAFCVSSVRSKQQQLHNGTRGLASLLYADPSHISTAEQVVAELSPEQRGEIRTMQRLPNIYERLAESLCPTTFGHETIKKGLLLMLLGGVHKTTKDGIKLRGDTNVLIVGDPSTAKSQFLKYIHGFADNCVYTAGKASSSAGLTASVQRDSETGEYCIEAGALMLADNGICCIDEFDKVRCFVPVMF